MSGVFSCLRIGAWLLLATLPGLAQASVQLVGLEGRVQPSAPVPALFGGRDQKIDLNVKGITTQIGPPLHADLFQVAGGLARPIARNLQLEESFALSPASPWAEQITLRFPEVECRTEILVRLAASAIHHPNLVVLGDLRFEVFPASVTQELIALLRPPPDGDSARVVVFGPGRKLRHFFTSLHVPFEEGGDGTPDRFDPNLRYFGELSTDEQFQQAQDRSEGAHLVLFSPDEALPEGIYAERTDSGTLVHVTSPLLDNLHDDPRAQLGLIKIIHFLSDPPPSSH